MPIEVTSVPERRWSLLRDSSGARRLFRPQLSNKALVFRLILVLAAAGVIAVVVVGGTTILCGIEFALAPTPNGLGILIAAGELLARLV